MARNPEQPRPGAPGADDAIAQAAAEWAVRHDRPLDAAELREFEAWKAADPRHAAEWARLHGAWNRLGEVGAVSRLAAMADLVEVRAKRRRQRRRILLGSSAFAAAAAALALVAVGWWRTAEVAAPMAPVVTAPPSYRVLASTARRLPLADGSVAELNTAGRIELDFTGAERRVHLMQGEAHFAVAHDAARPFLVSAGAVTVRAVGTAFDVRLAADRVEVLVTEGRVRLEGAAFRAGPDGELPALVAGQRTVVDTAAGAPARVVIATPTRAEIDEALAWKSTRLFFDKTPLNEVVAAFNRFNPQQITLGSPVLAERTLTGIIRADNLDGLLRALETSVDVTAERRTDSLIVLQPTR